MRKGFSLVELMIVFAIIAIFCLISGTVLGLGRPNPSVIEDSAERNAKEFADKLAIKYQGLSCSGADSDSDGYVTCTLNLGDSRMQAIECGYDRPSAFRSPNTGCKEKTLKVIVPSVQ